MLGHVSSHWLLLLHRYLDQKGLDAATVTRVETVTAAETQRLPVAQWRNALEAASQAISDPALGLQVGASMSLRELGVLGYVISASSTLGDALLRLQRFERLVYQLNPFSMRSEGESLLLEWSTENGCPGQLVDETAIAALLQCARELLADVSLTPSRVTFVNAEPENLEPYETFFGLRPQFNARTTVVSIPVDWLSRPLRTPDSGLLVILEQQADSLLAQIPGDDSFEHALRRSLVSLIAQAEPTLERTANELHCSTRTLQRRLDTRGLKFQTLLDDCRETLAKEYLADYVMPLSEIALLLGYAEQSVFNRAFRRWQAQTPRQYRQSLAARKGLSPER